MQYQNPYEDLVRRPHAARENVVKRQVYDGLCWPDVPLERKLRMGAPTARRDAPGPYGNCGLGADNAGEAQGHGSTPWLHAIGSTPWPPVGSYSSDNSAGGLMFEL